MKRQVSGIAGAALDWAVAAALNKQFAEDRVIKVCRREETMPAWIERQNAAGSIPHYHRFDPSENWEQAGPIIDRALIAVEPEWHNQHCAVVQDWQQRGFSASHGWHWCAHVLGPENLDDPHTQEGGTPLIAAMRCYVASKLGDTIDIPDNLE